MRNSKNTNLARKETKKKLKINEKLMDLHKSKDVRDDLSISENNYLYRQQELRL